MKVAGTAGRAQGRIRITGTMAELKRATGRERLREIFLELLDNKASEAARV